MLLTLFLSVALVSLFAVHFLRKAYDDVHPDDIAALHVLSGTPARPSTDRLFAAYLSRARRYRTSWSVVGWLGGVVLALGLRDSQALYGNPVIMGPIGYFAGAIVAELHHLRRRGHGVRTASLAPRHLADYAPAHQQRLLRALILVMAAVVGVGLVLNATNESQIHRDPPFPPTVVREARSLWVPLLVLGALALAVWIIVERTERVVVQRPRPAMPDELAEGDDAIRATSVQTLALGGAGFLALLISTAVLVIGNGVTSHDVQPVTFFCWLALFVLALRLLFRARRLVWPARKLEVDGAPV